MPWSRSYQGTHNMQQQEEMSTHIAPAAGYKPRSLSTRHTLLKLMQFTAAPSVCSVTMCTSSICCISQATHQWVAGRLAAVAGPGKSLQRSLAAPGASCGAS